MAGSISDALEIKLLDHVLKNDAFSVPANIYIALSTADPLEDGSGIAEPVGNGYARVVCNTWDVAASRAIENTNPIVFAEAEGSWGTITHFAIFDAITGGNFLAHGELPVAKAVGDGGNVSFIAGALDVGLSSGAMSTYLANKLLDHVFKTTSYSQPTNIYVALADTTIVDGTTGTTISEPSGGAYERKQHEAYDAAAAGASENIGAITFVTATASWGTVTDVALIDAATVGNILLYAVLGDPRNIGIDDVARFVDGAFDFTLT